MADKESTQKTRRGGRVRKASPAGESPNLVMATSRITEEQPVMGSDRKRRLLVAEKGGVLLKSQAESLGALGKTKPYNPAADEQLKVNVAPERYVGGGVGDGRDLREVEGQPFDEATRSTAGGQATTESVKRQARTSTLQGKPSTAPPRKDSK